MSRAILAKIKDQRDKFTVCWGFYCGQRIGIAKHCVRIFQQFAIAPALLGAGEVIDVVGDLVSARVFPSELLNHCCEIMLVLRQQRDVARLHLQPRVIAGRPAYRLVPVVPLGGGKLGRHPIGPGALPS